ncbi:MAG: hypothetical protein HY657_20120 [Acidobacteria bacterium]|nr:hypothetical protein [Acidobacteriota bacterium]
MHATARFLHVPLAAALVFLVRPATMTAQSPSGTPRPTFDIARLADSEGMFETFHVTETQPLRQALDQGILDDQTRLLVTETASGQLALLTDQMAFHHIAQGMAGGQEWMVTF